MYYNVFLSDLIANFAFESFLVFMSWCNMIFKSTIERVSFPNEHFSQKAKAKKKKFYWNYLTFWRKIVQSFFIVKIWNRFSQWIWGNTSYNILLQIKLVCANRHYRHPILVMYLHISKYFFILWTHARLKSTIFSIFH